MELTNDFRVKLPVDDVWSLLADIPRIAPCLPGARLEQVDGDHYQGTLTVTVGSVTVEYRGRATFKTLDRDTGRMVIRGEGHDTKGQSNAEVTMTATLRPEGEYTRVTAVVEFTLTGKITQFARSVMADVSAKLVRQFSECLDSKFLPAGVEQATVVPPVTQAVPEPEPVPVPAPAPATVVTADQVEAPPLAPVAATGPDTGERAAGPAVATVPSSGRRLLPALAVVVGIWLLVRLLRRRRA